MMDKRDSHDLFFIKQFLEDFPNTNIVLVANSVKHSKMIWEKLKGHLNLKQRPHIVSQHVTSTEGLSVKNSMTLFVGRWWENENALNSIHLLKRSFITFPISYIPPYNPYARKAVMD